VEAGVDSALGVTDESEWLKMERKVLAESKCELSAAAVAAGSGRVEDCGRGCSELGILLCWLLSSCRWNCTGCCNLEVDGSTTVEAAAGGGASLGAS